MGEIEEIEYRGRIVKIERKPSRRTMTIILKPHQPVLIRVPVRVALRTILTFLESKQAWIARHQEQFQRLLPRTLFEPGARVHLLGTPREVVVVPTLLSKTFISETPERLQIHQPTAGVFAQTSIQEMARDFYRRRAVEVIAPRFHEWVVRTGLRPTHFRLREARSRWGSCNSKGRISLNWRMVVYDLEIIDAIIVHELSHLRHLNHSKQFWAEVESHFPRYQEASRRLKDQTSLADFLEPVRIK